MRTTRPFRESGRAGGRPGRLLRRSTSTSRHFCNRKKPVMAVSNATSTSSSGSSSADPAKTNSLTNLTSNNFLKLLITQLQNQDPTQPVGNDELLQQLSAMRALQSNVELSDTLNNLANNQAISSGAAFLGKIVTGTNANQQPVTGIA